LKILLIRLNYLNYILFFYSVYGFPQFSFSVGKIRLFWFFSFGFQRWQKPNVPNVRLGLACLQRLATRRRLVARLLWGLAKDPTMTGSAFVMYCISHASQSQHENYIFSNPILQFAQFIETILPPTTNLQFHQTASLVRLAALPFFSDKPVPPFKFSLPGSS